MASPSITYTFTASTTISSSEINQNFTDVINGITDGTKDLSISALTCAGAATFNGNVTFGNASTDTVTFTSVISGDVTMTSTDAGGTAGPTLDLFRNSASPLTTDLLGQIEFNGENASSTKTRYAAIAGRIKTTTAGSEDGSLRFYTINSGADNLSMYIDNDGSLYVDATTSGAAAQVELFDDYDDPKELQTIIQQGEIDRAVEMGIAVKRDDGGYMFNQQKMTRLLAGGIYQLYDRINKLEASLGIA